MSDSHRYHQSKTDPSSLPDTAKSCAGFGVRVVPRVPWEINGRVRGTSIRQGEKTQDNDEAALRYETLGSCSGEVLLAPGIWF